MRRKTTLDAMAAHEGTVTFPRLLKLAADLTERTGEPHGLYVTSRGVAVYPEKMATMMGYGLALSAEWSEGVK